MLKHVATSFAMSAMVVICNHSLGIEQLRGHGNWTAQVSLASWKQHEAMQAVAPSVTRYRLICLAETFNEEIQRETRSSMKQQDQTENVVM